MTLDDHHDRQQQNDPAFSPPPSPFLPPPTLTQTSSDNSDSIQSVETSSLVNSHGGLNLLQSNPTDTNVIHFETGNPDTGTVICGTMNVRELDAQLDTTSQPTMYTMESVPGVMTTAELCNFITPLSKTILHLRTLRLRTHANQYVVVVKLKSHAYSAAFLSEFCDKPYLRDLTKETCVIRVVTNVNFHPPTSLKKHPKEKPKQKKEKRKRKNSYLLAGSKAHPSSSSEDKETDDKPRGQGKAVDNACQHNPVNNNGELATSKSSASTSLHLTPPSKVSSCVFPHSLMFPIDVDESSLATDITAVDHISINQGLEGNEGAVTEELEVTQTDTKSADGSPSSMVANCSVCLERMDTHDEAVITIFCNHTMHASCLGKWGLNWCPVCRHAHVLTPEATTCLQCGQRDGLWMCIVCAFVGCGFTEQGKHAYEHYQDTLHPFVTNLTECTFWTGDVLRPGCVWDYSAERFVNRLVASEDGKVVEVKSDDYDDQIFETTNSTVGPSSSAMAAASSSHQQMSPACRRPRLNGLLAVDDDVIEREIQTALYVSRMDAEVAEYRRRLTAQEAEHEAERQLMQQQLQSLQVQISEVSKERKALARKCSDSEKEMKTLREKYEFLKNLNETLLRDKHGWDQQVAAMKTKVQETTAENQALQEQLRDIMLHLETQNKISESGTTADVGAAATPSTSDSCRSDVSELRGADVVRVGPSRRERLAMKTNRKYSGT